MRKWSAQGVEGVSSIFTMVGGAAYRVPVAVMAVSFFVVVMFIYSEDIMWIADLSMDYYDPAPDAPVVVTTNMTLPPEQCDLAAGEWVRDNVSFPFYREEQCTFLMQQVTCAANGRRDDDYQH